jgi:hypothetical protein
MNVASSLLEERGVAVATQIQAEVDDRPPPSKRPYDPRATGQFDPEIFAGLLDNSPLADTLDEATRSYLLAILTAPLSVSISTRPSSKAVRERYETYLKFFHFSPAAIAAYLKGLESAGHTRETLIALESAGLIVTWQTTVEAVTLTPYAAKVLGVVLAEVGSDDNPDTRWSVPDLIPRPIRARQQYGTDQDRLSWIVDPTPGGVDDAIDDEARNRKRERLGRDDVVLIEERRDDGAFNVDPDTGKIKLCPLLLLGARVRRDRRIKGRSGSEAAIALARAKQAAKDLKAEARARAIAEEEARKAAELAEAPVAVVEEPSETKARGRAWRKTRKPAPKQRQRTAERNSFDLTSLYDRLASVG